MSKFVKPPLTEWDARFIRLAKEISTWSKDKTQIGAVVVGDKKQILAQGYNGFPRGIKDSDERLADRDTKLKFVVHAEMNCIYNAGHNGVSLNNSTIYVHGLPVCSECAKGIIQVGIKRVVMSHSAEFTTGPWAKSHELTREMFNEVGVTYYYDQAGF